MNIAIKPDKWESIGPLDLIPQLEEGQRWACDSLVKHGSVEPPNGGDENRCMRAISMPVEACAYYYAMTGDESSLEAIRRAVAAFRKYRHAARGRRIPYPEMGKHQTIEYQMIAIHVGRNMRGMRAGAHVLEDHRLLEEVREELHFWIETPPGYDRERHRFTNRLFFNEDGSLDTDTLESWHTMNLMASLATAMWLTGDDVGDETLKDHARDQILEGVLPYQFENGFFPYCYRENDPKGEMALKRDNYHVLTLQILSALLPYPEWRGNRNLTGALLKGAEYVRSLTLSNGKVDGEPNMRTLREWEKDAKGWPGMTSPWHQTADSALLHTRLFKYLGDGEAFEQAEANLRWLHHNAPLCIPFLPGDQTIGMEHLATENGYSHVFRQIIMTAYEGAHLKKRGVKDVELEFIQQ